MMIFYCRNRVMRFSDKNKRTWRHNIMTFGNNKWTTEQEHIDLQSLKDIVRSITKLLKP